MTAYHVHVGISYPPGRRAEPGDRVTDLPPASINHLLARGHITPADRPVAEPESTTTGGDG